MNCNLSGYAANILGADIFARRSFPVILGQPRGPSEFAVNAWSAETD